MRNPDRITRYYAAHTDVNGRHFSLRSPMLSRSPTKRVSAIPRKQSAADHADLTADGRGGRSRAIRRDDHDLSASTRVQAIEPAGIGE